MGGYDLVACLFFVVVFVVVVVEWFDFFFFNEHLSTVAAIKRIKERKMKNTICNFLCVYVLEDLDIERDQSQRRLNRRHSEG